MTRNEFEDTIELVLYSDAGADCTFHVERLMACYDKLQAENAQLKAELAQAKRGYDGAVAAHHEAKRQYRELIESHTRELAGWEAAHRALDNALATATQREAQGQAGRHEALGREVRRILETGMSINQDYQAGKYQSDDEYVSHLEAVTRKRVETIEQLLQEAST